MLRGTFKTVATPRGLLLSVALLAVAILVVLSTGAVLRSTPFELRLDPDQIDPEQGYAYVSRLQPRWPWAVASDDFQTDASATQVFEDGQALGPAHTPHASIRSAGGGSFSHWRGTLYFSTSDNSDPRTNGRRYVAHLRVQLAPELLLALLLGLGIAAFWASKRFFGDRSASPRTESRQEVPGSVETGGAPQIGWQRLSRWSAVLGGVLALLVGIVILRWESTILAAATARGLSLLLMVVGVAVGVLSGVWARARRVAEKAPRSAGTVWMWQVLGAGAVCLLFLVPVFDAWTRIQSGYSMGMLLPLSDAAAYFSGAEMFLDRGELDAWNCRRPLNALLLAVRLAITGGDLQLAILLQATMLGLAVYFLARTVAKDLGIAPALLLIAALFASSWQAVPTLLSEPLGLTLGALATAALWSGARSGSLPVVLVGIFATTVAQNARIGTVLVLPALVLWVLFTFKRRGRLGFAPAGWACAVIVAALLLDGSLRMVYGVGFSAGHGNFSLPLYGFSTGSPGWQTALQDLPELQQLEEEERNRRVYAAAWQNIRERPWRFVQGLWAGVGQTRDYVFHYLRRIFAVSYSELVNGLVLLFLIIGMLRYAWRTRRADTTTLLTLGLFGVAVSAPIVVPDGESRVLAPALPLILLPLCTAIVGWRPGSDPIWRRLSPPRRADTTPGLLVVAMVVAACLGPALSLSTRAGPAESGGTVAGEAVVWVRASAPHLTVLAPDDPRTSFAPRVRHEEFLSYVAMPSSLPGLTEVLASNRGQPFAIVLAREPGWIYPYRWLVGPQDLLADQPRLLRLKAQRFEYPGIDFLVVESYDVLDSP